MNKIEQKKLVEACKNQNRYAMEKIYNFYVSRMITVSMRYCKNLSDAEDVVQEAFIKVFRNIKNYNHNGKLGHWIERIVVNCSIDYWHKKKKVIPIDSTEFIKDNEDILVSEYDLRQEQIPIELVRNMISELPEQYRFVLNLYAVEGYSHKEIGEMLKIKESTSRSNYTRARKKLLENIKNSGVLLR